MMKTILQIVALIVWIGAGLSFLSEQSLIFSFAELTKPSGSQERIRLPYFDRSTENGISRFDLFFEARNFPTRSFLIWVDDCLEDISLNGISLSYIGRRCLDDDGLIVDFSKAYKQGKNHLQIKIKDTGGMLKLKFKPHANSNTLETLKFVFLAGLFMSWKVLSKDIKDPHLRSIIGIGILAFVLRFLFIFILHPLEDHLFSDMAGHKTRAGYILDGVQQAKHVEKPPGFQYLVALSLYFFDSLTAIKFINLIASFLTCFIGAKASRSYFGKNGSILMLAILAVHLPLIFLGGILMEECLFALLITILFWQLTKKGHFSLKGITFGLAFCLKGTHVFFPPLAIINSIAIDFIREKKFSLKKLFLIIRPWIAFTLGALLIIILQLSVTYKIYGTAKFPSAGAVNFLEGKCEGDRQIDINGGYRYSPLYPQIDRERTRSWPFAFIESNKVWLAGLNCIRENPFVLWSSLSSVYYLFMGNFHWPFNLTDFQDLNSWYGMVYSFFVFPGIILGLIRLAKSPRKFFAFLPAMSLFICVWFFKSEVRFRVPFDAIFLTLSALGWASTIKGIFPHDHKKIITSAAKVYVFIVGFGICFSFLGSLINELNSR